MRPGALKAFVEYVVRTFIRDKSEVFWVLLWPALLVFITAYVFVSPSAGGPMSFKVGVVNLDNSSAPFNGTALIKMMEKVEFNGTKIFKIKQYKSLNEMMEDLKKGKLGAGLLIPKGFGKNVTEGTARLTVYVSGGSKLTVQLNKEAIQSFFYELSKRLGEYKVKLALKYLGPLGDEEVKRFLYGIANPLNVTVKEELPSALAARATVLGWFVMGAMGMAFLYTGFIIGATAVVAEKEKGTLERILAAPVTESEFLAGKLLGGLVILALSALVTVLAGLAMGAKLVFDPFNPYHWLGLLSLLLAGISSISIGFLLSLVTKSSRAATNLGIMLGMLLSFAVGVWVPKKYLPTAFKVIANLFPPTWGLDVTRNTLLFNRGAEVLPEFLNTILGTVILFVFGVVAYKRTLRRYVEA